jgi:hypothetical protein
MSTNLTFIKITYNLFEKIKKINIEPGYKR